VTGAFGAFASSSRKRNATATAARIASAQLAWRNADGGLGLSFTTFGIIGEPTQLGDEFTMRRLMDQFDAAGPVPASLLRWELTEQMLDNVRPMLSS